MTNESQSPAGDPFARLRRVSKVMVVAVTLGMIGLVTLVALVFLVPAVTRVTLLPELASFGINEVTPRGRMLGFLVLALPLAVFLYGLNEARLLFAQYAAGDVLTSGAARRLKRLAWITILGALLRAPTRLGLFLALSIDHAERHLPIRINAGDFTFLLFGLLLLAIAWIMAEAARIAEEHGQIV